MMGQISKKDIENMETGILIDLDNRKNLFVSFGGMMQGLGVPTFEFFNSIENIECDKIFLRDFKQVWYHNGVDEKINSIKRIQETLAFYINNKYQKVIFLGNSMGGYAAILFGTLIGVDTVLSFAPQTFIGKWNRWWMNDKRWNDKIEKIYSLKEKRKEYFDLKSICKKINKKKTQINIYYSPEDSLDQMHAERLDKFSNIKLYKIEKGGHSVVKTLRDNHKLIGLIESSFY